MSIFQRIRQLFARLWGRAPWFAVRTDDVPEVPSPRTVYLIGDDEVPWAAALTCPCGCGALIQLSLIPGDDPSWVASIGQDGRASIHPSIWRIRGCRSHFFIKAGRLTWAKEASAEPEGPAFSVTIP